MIEILEHVIVWNPSSSAKKELTNLITHVQHKIDKWLGSMFLMNFHYVKYNFDLDGYIKKKKNFFKVPFMKYILRL